MKTTMKTSLVVLAALCLAVLAAAGEMDGSTEIASVIYIYGAKAICGFYYLFIYIAGAIAAFVIVYMGIKWIGSDNDPGVRKQAKEAINAVVVGLVIVIVAASLVSLIITGGVTPC